MPVDSFEFLEWYTCLVCTMDPPLHSACSSDVSSGQLVQCCFDTVRVTVFAR